MTPDDARDFRLELFERSRDLLGVVSFDGRFLELNARWEAVLGLTREELLAVPVLMWVHPEDREDTGAAARRIREGAPAVDFDSRFLTSSGEYRWLRWSCTADGERRAFFAVARDVTEARRELDLFRLAVEAAPTGIVIVDAAGRIVLVNKHLEALFGYSRAELLGEPVALLLAPALQEDHARWITQYFSRPDTRAMGAGRDLFGVRRDGSRVPLEIGLNPMVTPNGTLVLASIVDITSRRRQEAEVHKHVAELQRHRREMTALGELSALLQHAEAQDEPPRLVLAYADRLFPDIGLGIYLDTPSGRDLELAAARGGFAGEDRMLPTACWALRRGASHLSSTTEEPRCGHLADDVHHLCVPLAAHGRAVGLLALRVPDPAGLETLAPLAKAVADQLALAISHLELRERLRHLSVRDPLTDLYNRRYLEEAVEHELARARRGRACLGVLMIDIDHFKRFNDEHGHPAADVALKGLAASLVAECRGEDIVCRYGGEEFVVLVPGAGPTETAALAERIRAGAERSTRGITLSIGAACFPDNGTRWDELIAHADVMVYEAKRLGRNRVVGPLRA